MLMPQWLGLIGGIILVDLVLSGDNALVIGAAASGLPRKQRWPAIAVGGAGAIILRVGFAIAATFLLNLPLLQAIGGALLLIIALRLLTDRSRSSKPSTSGGSQGDGEAPETQPKRSFLKALLTILVADATMSLDNILAVGAIADGRLSALAVGLFGSIALILVGSALISELIKHLPLLLDAACLVLAWTGGKMMLDDTRLGALLVHIPNAYIVIPIAAILLILAADIFIRYHARHAQKTQTPGISS